jgi:hypothetical protein
MGGVERRKMIIIAGIKVVKDDEAQVMSFGDVEFILATKEDGEEDIDAQKDDKQKTRANNVDLSARSVKIDEYR